MTGRTTRSPTAPLPAGLLEEQFQRTLIHTARTYGWLVHHARTAPTRSGGWATPIQGDKGFCDLVLARDGVVLMAELKRDGKYPDADQRRWHTHLGDLAVVWRPKDWPAVVAFLSAPRTAQVGEAQ